MQTAALIVAAGMSSRMGDFKPMLSIGSITIAQRVIATFHQAGIEKIVMVTGYQAVTLERHLSGSGVIFLRNDRYETTQMFDSVKIGLEYLMDKCDRVLFTPVDVPLFTAETVRRLLDANAVLAAAGKPALKYFDAANPSCYQVDQGGAWSAAAAKEYMDTNFVTYNETNGNMIELGICNNDGMAEGVIASLQEKGYNKEGAHTVPVFGVDATDNAKALIAEGAMAGTIKQDAEGMAAAVAQTVKAVAGGMAPADALASLSDDRFSIAEDSASKLYVAYAPYTGA